jgi:hypothetical protein
MSGRQLARLAAVLGALVLLWAAAALAGRRSARAAGGAERLLGADTSKVDSVVLRGPSDTAVLVRGSGGGWTVNGQPAARDEITSLLRALADTSRFDLVAESETSHSRLGVSADSGRHLRVAGAHRIDLIVGAKPGGFGGGYARQAGERAVYQLRGSLANLVIRPADDWRDKTVAALAADSIASIEVARGRERYELRREGNRWEFARGGIADSTRAADLVRALTHIRASGFATRARADSAQFSRPDRRLTVKGTRGTLAALVFDSTTDGFLVRADSGGTVWRMEAWEADQITPAVKSMR